MAGILGREQRTVAYAADLCIAEERADEMRWALECGDVTRPPYWVT